MSNTTEVTIRDYSVTPDAIVHIELSDGRWISAGLDTEVDEHGDPTGDTYVSATAYRRDETGLICDEDFRSEVFTGRAPTAVSGPHAVVHQAEDARDVIAAVAELFGVER